jgi:hypothetical protein
MFSNCLAPVDGLADAEADGDGELDADGEALLGFSLLLEPHPASIVNATTEAATVVNHFFDFIR